METEIHRMAALPEAKVARELRSSRSLTPGHHKWKREGTASKYGPEEEGEDGPADTLMLDFWPLEL